MCRGAEKSQIVSSDVNVERGEEPPMSVPGPYTIAHDLSYFFTDLSGDVNPIGASSISITHCSYVIFTFFLGCPQHT